VLKAVTRLEDRRVLLLLGLTHANLARIVAGQPVDIDVGAAFAELGAPLEGTPATALRVLIFTGESEATIARQLEDAVMLPPGSADQAAETLGDGQPRHGAWEP
jgi:hypothetical protein